MASLSGFVMIICRKMWMPAIAHVYYFHWGCKFLITPMLVSILWYYASTSAMSWWTPLLTSHPLWTMPRWNHWNSGQWFRRIALSIVKFSWISRNTFLLKLAREGPAESILFTWNTVPPSTLRLTKSQLLRNIEGKLCGDANTVTLQPQDHILHT